MENAMKKDETEDQGPKVLLYIDNSNIFDNAKKYSALKKGYKNGIVDVACRIDIEKLVKTAVGERVVFSGKLYGSEPPALDSVWEAIRRKQVHVKTFERSKLTSREKQTDTQLTADVCMDIVRQKPNVGSSPTVIIFSGDVDLFPCIKYSIEEDYKVEVWSFKAAMNKAVKRHAAQFQQSLKVVYIDDIFNDVTFTKYYWGDAKFPRERSLVTELIPITTRLISFPAGTDKKEFLRQLVAKAGEVFRMPVMGKYFDQFKCVVLIPCIKELYTPRPTGANAEVDSIRKYSFYMDIMPFTHQLEEHYGRQQISIKLEAWIEFLATRHSAEDVVVATGNRFGSLAIANDDVLTYDNDDEEEEEDVGGTNDVGIDNDEEFEEDSLFDLQVEEITSDTDSDFVPITRKPKMSKRMYSSMCLKKFWCIRGSACAYKHSLQEKEYFKIAPSQIRRYYKIKPCYHSIEDTNRCKYKDKSYLCGYAHGLEESRCLCCKDQAEFEKHWMDQCPLNMLNQEKKHKT